jgi:ubiquitin-like-conjugating enzyme ATG3
VETHAGRKSTIDSAANPGEIDDIPDLDGPQEADSIAADMNNLSLGLKGAAGAGDTPDLDLIPDMEEEDLEAGDEATAAPKITTASAGVIDARYFSTSFFYPRIPDYNFSAKWKLQRGIYCKCGHMMS